MGVKTVGNPHPIFLFGSMFCHVFCEVGLGEGVFY